MSARRAGVLSTHAHALACVLALSIAGCGASAKQAPRSAAAPAAVQPTPPVAPRHPLTSTLHGDVRVDDYAWLRAKDTPEVLAYLRAENAYTERVTAPTQALQKQLYEEFLGRIQQTDRTPGVRRGGYLYYSRTEQGKQYPIHCRRLDLLPNSIEEVILDLNALAEGEPFLGLGSFELSDDGNLLAYSLDTTGFREYTLHVKDLRTGDVLPDAIEKVSSVAWAADGRTLLYTVEDEAKRSYRLYRHVLGAAQGADPLVYEEKDERFWLTVSRTRSKAYLLLTAGSHTASEVRYVAATTPDAPLTLIAPRRDAHEYYIDHRGPLFYVLTNDAHRNFRVVTAPVATPDEAHWRELVPASDAIMLEDLSVFDDFFAVHEREDGVSNIRITQFAPDSKPAATPQVVAGSAHRIALPEAVHEVYAEENPEPDADRYRFSYESLTTPETYYDYAVAPRTLEMIKQKAVLGGYDAENYIAERVHARAADGTDVPVSLVYRKDLGEGPHPMLLTGYGAYGYPLPATFSYARVSLLDRGYVYAIAHVRGGGELGKRWHDAGRMANKQNTFGDFIAVARQLIAEGRTAPDRLAIEGASAGGLLIGAVINQAPELFRAALLDVPFVDVINTMNDPSLPLTVGEYEEWGNPQDAGEYRTMLAYSPYDNLRAQPYPALLVKTSYNDSQVMYWEPAKYVAKLRALGAGKEREILLWVNMAGGHGGASGRYDQLLERAFDFAFVLTQLGHSQAPR
jgi:oligopeptidase B